MTGVVAAVDLGGSSGRVMLGRVGRDELTVHPVARFANEPVRLADGLHWNILELYRNVLAGLGTALRTEPNLSSIGVDSWGVDFALLSGNRMNGLPYHHRDERNIPAMQAVHRVVAPTELYRLNGLQQLPFNTLYQLWADASAGALDGIDSLLLIPDLINFWLSGAKVAELTNASTTGLLRLDGRGWNEDLIGRLDLPGSLFPQLVDSGSPLGPLSPDVASDLGSTSRPTVTTVASHDTASAVVAVPSLTDAFAYISCGTWGLVGVEVAEPILDEEARLASFTNERGVDGRIRFLHNVMGLWLLSESVRQWERDGENIDLAALIAAAAAIDNPVPVFDASDTRFLGPGDMPRRITELIAQNGDAAPVSKTELVRSIFESLAESFARAVETACALSGARASIVHIVGGGSQYELLCQLTANRLGRPVFAGPAEATAIGNVLIQARAHGLVSGGLEALRALVSDAFPPVRFDPALRRGASASRATRQAERTMET